MKRKPQGKRRAKGDADRLKKFKASVEEFVQSSSGQLRSGEADDDYRGSSLPRLKGKSRKELRKEKRKQKKAKMKNYYEGKKQLDQDQLSHTMSGTGQEGGGGVGNVKRKMEKGKSALSKSEEAPSQKKAKNAKEKNVQQEKSNKKTKPVHHEAKKKDSSRLRETRKQALLEANVAEDKEIKRLERRLGLNKRKNKTSLPQSFAADGLDYILGVLDSGTTASGLYESDEETGATDDRPEKLEGGGSDNEQGDSFCGDSDTEEEAMDVNEEEEEEDGDDLSGDLEEEEETIEEAAEGGETEDTDEHEIPETEETQPVGGASGKYVPPALRETVDSQRRADLERLKRSVKGLVNRLSEPNMASISSQLEELYMSHSRKDMNDTLTDVLLAACVTPALMPDRLLMEHVLLVSILHHTVGLEVGAQFLETVVHRFEELYQPDCQGKECDNLLAIVAHLYNFHVMHSLLIFDILKKLTSSFMERDIELILFVLKNVGFALRKDDAVSLKELIAEAQSKANSLGTKFQDQTRVRFMLETMLALKNNDMRKIPGYDPEPVERLRKLQRTLVHRSAAGSDVRLRVSLENLLAADKVGRWWIVGSSWSGAPMIDGSANRPQQATAGGQFSTKVLDLARKQRMNTDIRRNIFCVVMTSEDYLDAFEKLLRLGLKDQQEREIVHVLMDCCLQEKTFNAFYAVLGEKFCAYDRRFQNQRNHSLQAEKQELTNLYSCMTFQFSMWDKFRDLTSMTSSTFSNLVHLLVHFLKKKSLSLSVLKAIEFSELDKHKVRFLRQVLTKLLRDTEPEELTNIFVRISGIPKLGMLKEGLKLFISHFLLKNVESLETTEQANLLKERADIAIKALEARDSKLKL
uniref:Nucleolar MIF4G domain-containing protein 1 n=1 Tax=Lepisosteus oculatus TaxID=7918 RepID=W5N3X3_LEPOC|nr:PREDICTED: nucleolar MIF4G domain-containing protein 1 isoform X1 [Lepisosteus oculatus]